LAFSVFGASNPTLSLNEGDATAYDLGMAFYPFGTHPDWVVTGAKVFIPAGSTAPTTGYVATLWQGNPASTATKLDTANFATLTIGAWNEVYFASSHAISNGNFYWISVYFPGGKYGSSANKFDSTVQAIGGESFYAAGFSEVTPGNGAFVSGQPAGTALASASATHAWFGVDVIVGNASEAPGGGADSVGITDAVTAVRSGLAPTTTVTATATDVLDVTTSSNRTINNTGTVARTLTRSLLGQRLNWGSPMDASIQGPTFATDATPVELAAAFKVQWTCRLTKVRIYKAPALAGTVPVTVWAPDNSVLATLNVTWTADAGGWREITFSSPITLAPDVEYRVSYNAVNSNFATSPWVFNAQDFVEPPFYVRAMGETGGVKVNGSSFAATHVAPTLRSASNYYVDPIVEWDTDLPGYGAGYGDQWTNHTPANAFPVGVFYCDPPFIAEYLAMGITTLVAIPIGQPGYRDAIVGTNADVWAPVSSEDIVLTDPSYGTRVQGYFLWDEPDMTHNYGSPQQLRDALAASRRKDSSRPIMLNLGMPSAKNQGWTGAPVGGDQYLLNANWQEYADTADFFSCDFYNMSADAHEGRYGIWTYPLITARMKSISQGRKPVWGYVETTSPTPNEPTPQQVYNATWAHLIAGANGIVYFDHRFADSDVTQDFAAMLHDAPMKAKVTALAADIQALAVPLKDNDRGLVTAWTSSNTTAGPKGGTFGVPLHFTTRRDATKTYLFAQAIRPGTTTGTFTVPSAAGKTITVRGESRTLTADGSGVFSDSFASDYAVHLYEWTT
jgi:hypothetical protein